MSPRAAPRAIVAGLLAAAGLGTLAITTSGSSAPGDPGARPPGAHAAQRLGPLPGNQPLRVALALRARHEPALHRLIASGHAVSSTQFARRFLPPAAAVRAGIRQLEQAGLTASWAPGSTVIAADGPASAVEGALHVSIDRFRNGRHAPSFYAPVGQPHLQGALHGLVGAVTGVSNESHLHALADPGSGPATPCGAGAGGYRPEQILSAYNFGPLAHAGLTGAGQTVVFVEMDAFRQSDLDCARARFNQPPYDVTSVPEQWGQPDPVSDSGGSETDLDLEVVHAAAPGAHLVVYETDGTVDDVAAAFAAAVSAHPTAIMSISLGGCEIAAFDHAGNPAASADETVWHSALEHLAATGGSAFVSSGDAGAFECGSRFRDPNSHDPLPLVSSPAADPYATAVGGTTLFLGTGNTYAGEGAWGSPFEASGSGGGLSGIWARPSYQRGPGVRNGYSDGSRQVPDVAAVGDPSTGWEIAQNGSWDVVGGTSAAAPLWAGLTALADESLGRQRLAPVGFANPALYAFGQAPRRWPAPAFNDVTRGQNLLYGATPGWDFATGWGSPNAAALTDDLIAYRRSHR